MYKTNLGYDYTSSRSCNNVGKGPQGCSLAFRT